MRALMEREWEREREGDLILWMIVNGDERLNEGGFLGGIVLGMEREKEGGGSFFALVF